MNFKMYLLRKKDNQPFFSRKLKYLNITELFGGNNVSPDRNPECQDANETKLTATAVEQRRVQGRQEPFAPPPLPCVALSLHFL